LTETPGTVQCLTLAQRGDMDAPLLKTSSDAEH